MRLACKSPDRFHDGGWSALLGGRHAELLKASLVLSRHGQLTLPVRDAHRTEPNLSRLWFSCIPTLGGTTAFFLSLFGVVVYFVNPDQRLSVSWTVLTAFVLLTFIITLCDMIRRAFAEISAAMSESNVTLPRVLRWVPMPNGPVLFVEPSNFLGQGIAVSIYSIVDDFEILLGEGFVLAVQGNQKIQVMVTNFIDIDGMIWKSIMNNAPGALNNTLVRPGHQVQRRD